jgi:hypothetical protein
MGSCQDIPSIVATRINHDTHGSRRHNFVNPIALIIGDKEIARTVDRNCAGILDEKPAPTTRRIQNLNDRLSTGLIR